MDRTNSTGADADRGKVRVLLAEDHAVVRKGLADVIRDEQKIELVGEACDGWEAVEMAGKLRPDVIVMDVSMPRLDGVEAMRRIRAELPESRVIGLSMHESDDMAETMRGAGAVAYLHKSEAADILVDTILAHATPRTPPRATKTPAAPVFDSGVALKRCFNRPEMLADMISIFLAEIDSLFPQIRAALEKGDLQEAGRLGHRMKGTVAYLGAEPAEQAALGVERFSKSSGGTSTEAEEAVIALERECTSLKAALTEHLRAG